MSIIPVSPAPKVPYDDVTHLQLQRHQKWPQQFLVTRTVPGFMDFVTTVGNTVMVFTPQGIEYGSATARQPLQQTGS